MEEYKIYCTEEQVKKALELGAPIKHERKNKQSSLIIPDGKGDFYVVPTGEEMIGWLEEQDEILTIVIALFEFYWQGFVETTNYKNAIFKDGYGSRKEATLAAIDAALDYLSNNKLKK